MLKHLRYARYVIFHPFDGFYDIKHEKRGSVGASLIFMLLLVLVNIGKRQLAGYLFNINKPEWLSIGTEISSVMLPIVLFVVANWAITTLMDGEGSMLDILTYMGYAMVPSVILGVLFIVMTNVMTLGEVAFIQFVNVAASLWSGLLIFVATLTTHQYTVKKTLLSFLMTVVFMALILFIGTLFFTLIDKIVAFVKTIYQEMGLRA